MKNFINIMKEKKNISELLYSLNYEEMINKYKSIDSIDSIDLYFSYSAMGLMIDIIDPDNNMKCMKHLEYLYSKMSDLLKYKLENMSKVQYINNLKYELSSHKIIDIDSQYCILSLLILYCSIEEDMEKQIKRIEEVELKLKNKKIIKMRV